MTYNEIENNETTLLPAPKEDVIFRALFSKKYNKNTEYLISKILGKEVKIIEYLDKNNVKSNRKDKETVLDLNLRLEDGTICNVEVQLKYKNYNRVRFLDYSASIFSNQLQKGDNYNEIKNVITIVIIDYEPSDFKNLEAKDTLWEIRNTNKPEYLLTDKLKMYTIVLPKIEKRGYYIKDPGGNVLCQETEITVRNPVKRP